MHDSSPHIYFRGVPFQYHGFVRVLRDPHELCMFSIPETWKDDSSLKQTRF